MKSNQNLAPGQKQITPLQESSFPPVDPGGPPCPQDFFKIMQFSGNFKETAPPPFWANFGPVKTPLACWPKSWIRPCNFIGGVTCWTCPRCEETPPPFLISLKENQFPTPRRKDAWCLTYKKTPNWSAPDVLLVPILDLGGGVSSDWSQRKSSFCSFCAPRFAICFVGNCFRVCENLLL